MSTKTVVLSKKEIMDLKARYPMAQERKTPPYAIYQIKLSDCVITAYETRKVVFQGDGADYHADSYSIIEKKKVTKNVEYNTESQGGIASKANIVKNRMDKGGK